MGDAAFLVPLQNVRMRRSRFAWDANSPAVVRRSRSSRPVRPKRIPCRTFFMSSAQEQETKDPETREPESSSREKYAEIARELKYDKQRLELMAERARLESERAQLIAERRRLELEKYKELQSRNAKLIGKKSIDTQADYNALGESSSSAPSDPVSTPAETSSSTTEKRPSPGSPPFTPQSITELMGVDFPRVEDKDIEVIKEHVCGMKTFFVTEVDRSPFQERVVFRGNLRLDPEHALERLEELAAEHGLEDRVRLFLLLDPKDGDSDPKKPVLVALPAAAIPNQTNFLSTAFALLAAAVTVGTTFTYGIGIFGFTPTFINEIAKGNLDEVYYTIPISLGVLGLMAAHELGHRVMGKLRKVKLGLPFCIPSLQVGAFGTITPLESYPRTRNDLFDVAIAGPILGLACSIGALVGGLVLTGNGALADWFPQVPSSLFHASLLVGTLADLVLPPGLREQATLAVHPLTVIGYTGLLVNALNLLPIGRLDGGRIVQALYGRASANRISAISLILQGLSSVFGNSPLLLFWGLICVFLQRESDYPCQNEIVEPNDVRAVVGLAALFVMLAVLIPFPDQLGDILGRY